MSERKNLRAGLLGLIMVLAIGGLTILANRNAPTPAPATPAAAQQPASVGLQSLAELNNSTPARPAAPGCGSWPPRNCRCSTCA